MSTRALVLFAALLFEYDDLLVLAVGNDSGLGPALPGSQQGFELNRTARVGLEEGTRIVCPSSTRNCLPPALIIACDIFFYLSDDSNRLNKSEKSDIIGNTQVNSKPRGFISGPPPIRSSGHFWSGSTP